MPHIRFLLKVSRPRFWLYLFGPYIVGLAGGAAARGDLLSLPAFLFGLYFLFPANLLIYGVNDIFDFETDKFNPKKQDYEALVKPKDRPLLVLAIVLTNLPFVIAALFLGGSAILSLAGFLFFSIFYSAWPIRAKSLPIVDSVFNILYIFPAVFSFGLINGTYPATTAIIAGALWTIAMHAYSAIPDIESDQLAGVETVATFFGKNGTHLFCAACYLGSALLAFPYLGVLAGILGMIYLAMIMISLFSKKNGVIFRIYKYFPFINSAAGFLLFWFVALNNLR